MDPMGFKRIVNQFHSSITNWDRINRSLLPQMGPEKLGKKTVEPVEVSLRSLILKYNRFWDGIGFTHPRCLILMDIDIVSKSMKIW